MDLGKFTAWEKIAGLIAAVMAVLGLLEAAFGKKAIVKGLFQWVYKNTIFQIRLPSRITRIEGAVEEIKKMVGDVHHQTHTNGGGSMNDRQIRIEKQQGEQLVMLQALLEKMDEHKHTLRMFNKRLLVRDIVLDTMILHLTPAGRCEFANPFFLRLLGYMESDVHGIAWEGLIHPHDLPALRENIGRAAQSADDFTQELRIRDVHGAWYEAKFMAKAVAGDGELMKFYVVIHFIPDNDKK